MKHFRTIVPASGILLLLFFTFMECNKVVDPDPSLFGFEYFPLETGIYKVYDVEKITFPLSANPDTSFYQLKESIIDSLPDNAGELTFVLQRFKRSSQEEAWVTDSVWAAYRNNIQAVVNENNIPKLKLVFPLANGVTWDANRLNDRSRDDYEMTNTFEGYTNEGGDYESTVTVIQEQKLDSIISLDNRFEVYAQNIGLIERVVSRLDFCQEDDCRGLQIIKEGIIFKQVLTEYGKE